MDDVRDAASSAPSIRLPPYLARHRLRRAGGGRQGDWAQADQLGGADRAVAPELERVDAAELEDGDCDRGQERQALQYQDACENVDLGDLPETVRGNQDAGADQEQGADHGLPERLELDRHPRQAALRGARERNVLGD